MDSGSLLRFGDFTLDVAGRRLRRGDHEVPLTPRAFDVLAALVECRDRIVEKDELLSRVWPGTTVEEANLSQQIFLIRKALGDESSRSRFIATIPRRGYRWIAPVETVVALPDTPSLAPAPERRLARRWRWAAAVLALALGSAALLRLGGGGSADALRPSIRSLAVLPFATLSANADDAHFADGITEALIGELSRLGTIEVASRTSSSLYRDSARPIPEIARELDVDGVVEGSLLLQGDRVRISVRLVDGRTDRGLWANTYDRDLRDVRRVTGPIAAAVAREIALRVTSEDDEARLAGARAVSPEARLLYDKGLYMLRNQTRWFADALGYDNWPGVRASLEEAIALDPGYAAAHVGLADFFISAGARSRLPREEAFARADAAIRRALELDPTLAEAHAALGEIRLVRDWDWLAAERAYERALALDPRNIRAHTGYAGFWRSVGDLDRAVLHGQMALDLDPLSQNLRMGLAYELLFAGRLDEAAAHYREVLELDPRNVAAHWALAATYERQARYDEAGIEMTAVLELLGADTLPEFVRLLETQGYVEARRMLDARDVEVQLRQPNPDAWSLAFTYARLNDPDRAFEWLEVAYETRDPGLLQLRVDWDFEDVRSDPRFDDLVRRIGFPPQPPQSRFNLFDRS